MYRQGDAFELFISCENHLLDKQCILCIPISGLFRARMIHELRISSCLHEANIAAGSAFTLKFIFDVTNFFLGGRSFPRLQDGISYGPDLAIFQYQAFAWDVLKQGPDGDELCGEELDKPLRVGKFCICIPEERAALFDQSFGAFCRLAASNLPLKEDSNKKRSEQFARSVLAQFSLDGKRCAITGGSNVHCAHIVDFKYGNSLYQALADVLNRTRPILDAWEARNFMPQTSEYGIADIRCKLLASDSSGPSDPSSANHASNGFFVGPSLHGLYNQKKWVISGRKVIWLLQEQDFEWDAILRKLHHQANDHCEGCCCQQTLSQTDLKWNEESERNIPTAIKTACAIFHHFCSGPIRKIIKNHVQLEEEGDTATEVQGTKTPSSSKRGKTNTGPSSSPKRLKRDKGQNEDANGGGTVAQRVTGRLCQITPATAHTESTLLPVVNALPLSTFNGDAHNPSSSSAAGGKQAQQEKGADDLRRLQDTSGPMGSYREGPPPVPFPQFASGGDVYAKSKSLLAGDSFPLMISAHIDDQQSGPSFTEGDMPQYIMTQERANELEYGGHANKAQQWESHITAVLPSPGEADSSGAMFGEEDKHHFINKAHDHEMEVDFDGASETSDDSDHEDEVFELGVLLFMLAQHRQTTQAPPYSTAELQTFAATAMA